MLVVGDADLRELRRLVRPISKASGRTVDLTVLGAEEFRRVIDDRSSFARSVLDAPSTALVGDLRRIAEL